MDAVCFDLDGVDCTHQSFLKTRVRRDFQGEWKQSVNEEVSACKVQVCVIARYDDADVSLASVFS